MGKDIPRFLAKLPGSLAPLFAVKDFLVFLFFRGREPSASSEFYMRIALLQGSALFWGFAGLLSFAFNITFGALIGWMVLMAYRRAR
jgi:hypothetical protein